MFLYYWKVSLDRFRDVSFRDAVAGRRPGRPRACFSVGDIWFERAGEDRDRNPLSTDRCSDAGGACVMWELAAAPTRHRHCRLSDCGRTSAFWGVLWDDLRRQASPGGARGGQSAV